MTSPRLSCWTLAAARYARFATVALLVTTLHGMALLWGTTGATTALAAETAVGQQSKKAAGGEFTFLARERTADPDNAERERLTHRPIRWQADKTAVVICDMWDQHWCQGATRRVGEIAERMNAFAQAARERGALIIHCPSNCMESYADTPQRKLAQQAPVVETKIPLSRWCYLDQEHEAPLPIDDSNGGCDCEPRCAQGRPWKRQIAAIEIKEGDAITESAEAYYLMRQRGIENVIVMGVHANMCVLGRPFSIRQMIYQGQNVVLVRDLTDSMYDSRSKPKVSHARGNDLVIEHIERHWCPSIASTELTGQSPVSFVEDKRPHVVCMIGEAEYKTDRTLPQFVADHLAVRNVRTTFVFADKQDPNHFPGLEALESADLLIISVRRRSLTKDQMKLVRDYLERGGPVVGIRTASHAFGRDAPDENHVRWDGFDPEVLGGNYHNHYGNKEPVKVGLASWDVITHPIMKEVDFAKLAGHGTLYKTGPLKAAAKPLLTGTIPDHPAEPLAWTHQYGKSRVFYTSLGHEGDFSLPAFQQLFTNAIFWALDQPVPKAQVIR